LRPLNINISHNLIPSKSQAILRPMNNVSKAIKDLQEGRMIVVTDHHTRENEGDLIMAAEFANSQDINFMASFGKGLICAPMTNERAQHLQLPLMVQENECSHQTAFSVSIDAKHNISTGISAFDRAYTLKLLTSLQAQAHDFIRPGHIFPLIAKDGGVLERQGHTEATIDFLRLAELSPIGVICEIMNDHGEMARGAELSNFAEKHNLTLVSIEELTDYIAKQDKVINLKRNSFETRTRLS